MAFFADDYLWDEYPAEAFGEVHTFVTDTTFFFNGEVVSKDSFYFWKLRCKAPEIQITTRNGSYTEIKRYLCMKKRHPGCFSWRDSKNIVHTLDYIDMDHLQNLIFWAKRKGLNDLENFFFAVLAYRRRVFTGDLSDLYKKAGTSSSRLKLLK